MQILLGILLGAVVGVAVHFAMPHRLTRGAALAPVAGAAASAAVWTILTWIGLGADSPLVWLAALAVPVLVTVPLVAVLGSARTHRDAAERARLRLP